MPNASTLEILIAGGGIGGLSAATVLARAGHSVRLFERARKFAEVGAGIQISPNAMQVLTSLGLCGAMEHASFAPEFNRFKDWQTGEVLMETPLGNSIREHCGQPYYQIHRADLLNILVDAAQAAGVDLNMGHEVSGYNQDENSATLFTNKDKFSADLIIGAEGINSAIRAQMHGETPARFSGQLAWRGTVLSSALPKNTLSPGGNIWMGEKVHFVAYYLRGGKMINFVAGTEKDDWKNESWSTPGDMNELRKCYEGWDSPVTDILNACETTFLWGVFDRPPLSHWSDGRVAIMGDAAHSMLPSMAQGAAMAIEDAWALGHFLSQANCNSPKAMKSFETVRLPRTSAVQEMARENIKMFHAATPEERMKRNALMAMVTTQAKANPSAAHNRFAKVYGHDVTTELPLSLEN